LKGFVVSYIQQRYPRDSDCSQSFLFHFSNLKALSKDYPHFLSYHY